MAIIKKFFFNNMHILLKTINKAFKKLAFSYLLIKKIYKKKYKIFFQLYITIIYILQKKRLINIL